jgi:uncharacterized protein
MDVRIEIDGQGFVWDDAKADANALKHGVRFEEAATVFFDPLFVVVDASRHEDARHAVIGFDAHARLLYVVHVEVLDGALRLISARRATRDEEARYAE